MRRSKFSLFVVSFLLSANYCAADGMEFLDFGGQLDESPSLMRVGPGDHIHVQVNDRSPCGWYELDADGTLTSAFGTNGRLSGGCTADFVVAADNSLVTIKDDFVTLQVHDRAGAVAHETTPVFPQVPQFIRSAFALLRLSDGKIMAGGLVKDCTICHAWDWGLARFNADGSPDSTFAGGFLHQVIGDTSENSLRSMLQLPDGRLVAAGNRNESPVVTALSRYTDAGVDFAFGVNAVSAVTINQVDMAADTSNRIYVVGRTGTAARMSADGTLDGSYAAGTADNKIHITSAAMDSHDRLVIFGTRTILPTVEAYIARFDTAGNPDATFNGSGQLFFSFPRAMQDGCIGRLQSGDRPIIACSVVSEPGGSSQHDLGLARFTEAGALDLTFGTGQPDSDTYPDAFTFNDVTAPYGTVRVESAPATITGIDADSDIVLQVSGAGSQISVGCAGPWLTSTTIRNGQTMCVRLNASTTPGASASANVSAGGRIGTFTVHSSTIPADSIPDNFVFTPQTNVGLLAIVSSNVITVTGITGFTTATAANGAFSIGCDASTTVSSTTITNGTQLCVRHQASDHYGTMVSTTLNIGGVTSVFSTTTLAADSTPDAFSFAAQTSVPLSSVRTSGTITVAGLVGPAPISVTGGEYSIGCQVFTTTAGAVNGGDTVCVRHTSSATNSASTTTTLAIGGVSSAFTSTTVAAAPSKKGGGALDAIWLALLSALLILSRWRARVPQRSVTRNQSTSA